MYHGAWHIEPFSNSHDRTSFEMVFCCHHQQHGDHLQALTICQIHFGLVTMGCLLIGGILRFHHLPKPVLQTSTLFLSSFYGCNFQTNDNQTFNVYTKSTHSMYRKGLCVFSGFEIHPRRKLCAAKCCMFYGPEGVEFFTSCYCCVFHTSIYLVLFCVHTR